MEIWTWICEVVDSDEFSTSGSPAIFQLASAPSSLRESTQSIQLVAQRTQGPDSGPCVTYSVQLQGFQAVECPKTLWVSERLPLSSDKPFLALTLQLLREIVTLSPRGLYSMCQKSQLREIKPDPVAWVMETHSPESFSSFFDLVFLTRLFWSCAFDAPTEVGFLFFQSCLGPAIESTLSSHAPALRSFLISVGLDTELCFVRTVSYMLTKWLISKDVGVGLQMLKPLQREQLGVFYANEVHGLWILKGYFPVLGMKITNADVYHSSKLSILDAKDAMLKYALAHQQLEAVIQLDYSVRFSDPYIEVKARVNNIRIHVSRLGYRRSSNEDGDDAGYTEETHFPSRVRFWVGPEIGATYVTSLSLGRSTDNEERQVELYRIMKGDFGKPKAPRVKARAKMSTRTKIKHWRYDQDAEGNTAVFEAIMHDKETGEEMATLKPSNERDLNGFKNRYRGANRGFTKSGGVVFEGKEYGEAVGWRVSKDMEGSVLKWRMGGQVWLSYWPNKVKSSHYETRCVEWCDEVDLPLIPHDNLSSE